MSLRYLPLLYNIFSQHTVPLVEGLCSPYMRPRHWKLVLKYSPNLTMLNVLLRNGAVDTSALSQLTFGKFMDLKLTSKSHALHEQ